MSENTTPPIPDDLLARAEAALRSTPIPDGPDDATVARALAALHAAADEPTVLPSIRKRIMVILPKTAAAVLVAAGSVFYLASIRPATASTFAEMAAKLHAARTMTYRMAMEMPGLKEPARLTFFFKEPGRSRSETDGGGPITIIDMAQRKTLMLDPKSKTAMLLEDKGPKPPGAVADMVSGMAGAMRSLEKADSKPVGEREIGGVKTRGFRVALSPQQDMTIWGNPATDLPVLVESVAHTGGREVRCTMSDFVLDPELDDSLFRVAPPEGYTSSTVAAETLSDAEVKTVEEAVVRLLKVYTEKSGGTFPPKLDDFNMFEKPLSKIKTKPGALPDPELLRVVTVMVRFQLSAREIKNQYGYKVDGAKLGDAERVVFWYKPAGAAIYRAVFADLHIGDVAADKLPEPPKF